MPRFVLLDPPTPRSRLRERLLAIAVGLALIGASALPMLLAR